MNDFAFVFKGSQASESIDEKEHICYFSPNSKKKLYFGEIPQIPYKNEDIPTQTELF